jgi:glutathione reductase (NADPH)
MFDLIVIGGGSGGVRAARIAASLGAKVALIEEKQMGGTCVNVGCVPKKLFWYAAHFHEELIDAASFGWRTTEPVFDWPTLRANKDKEIERLNGIYERIMETHDVELVRGRGRVTGPNEVTVGDRVLEGKHILVATGGRPYVPAEIPGVGHAIVSDQVFHLEKWPERVVIVGGGYIATEFAGIFHGTGCEVHQLVRGPEILRGFDDDVRTLLCDEMRNRGIDVRHSCEVAEIRDEDHGQYTVCTVDGAEIPCDLVLIATGRVPLTRGLFADGVDVKMNAKGAIEVNERFQTSVPSIYAVGDVIDQVNLTPVALGQGMWLAKHLFGGESAPADFTNVATAVFSDPNVGTVGLTETEARERLKKIVVYRSIFTPMKNTISDRKERTLMKLIVDGETDKVVGCHMVGPHAGEIIQGIAIALKCGATKAQFDATIGIHPTAAEEFVTMRTPHAEIEI